MKEPKPSWLKECKPCDPRPAIGLWAPGDYINNCRCCGLWFIGDKRAGWCADCAYKSAAEPNPPVAFINYDNKDTMQNERLGELAYNAYCAARNWKSVRGEALPHWLQQDESLRAAWVAAAVAVWKEIGSQTGRG